MRKITGTYKFQRLVWQEQIVSVTTRVEDSSTRNKVDFMEGQEEEARTKLKDDRWFLTLVKEEPSLAGSSIKETTTGDISPLIRSKGELLLTVSALRQWASRHKSEAAHVLANVIEARLQNYHPESEVTLEVGPEEWEIIQKAWGIIPS